jgi:hypothetical protein
VRRATNRIVCRSELFRPWLDSLVEPPAQLTKYASSGDVAHAIKNGDATDNACGRSAMIRTAEMIANNVTGYINLENDAISWGLPFSV